MTPNPSLEPTRYGRHCKPGLSQLNYRLSPGLQYLPTGRLSSNVRPQVSVTERNAHLCLQVLAVRRNARVSLISCWRRSRLSVTRSGRAC
jgi:hypothetical protein